MSTEVGVVVRVPWVTSLAGHVRNSFLFNDLMAIKACILHDQTLILGIQTL